MDIIREPFIDAHAHLDDARFDADRREVIEHLKENGVLAVINPASDLESSHNAVLLAKEYPNIFACCGNHPHEAKYYNEETEAIYREMIERGDVVALGEIGLDYHYDLSDRKTQKEVFERQLQLARDMGIPVVIHTRDAVQDTYDILKNFKGLDIQMHSFSESREMAELFLDLGCMISLGGITTFKNAKKPKEMAKMVPMDRLLIETDSPYLTPVPYRGRRNEPKYTYYTAVEIAKLKGIETEEVLRRSRENAIAFFQLEDKL